MSLYWVRLKQETKQKRNATNRNESKRNEMEIETKRNKTETYLIHSHSLKFGKAPLMPVTSINGSVNCGQGSS